MTYIMLENPRLQKAYSHDNCGMAAIVLANSSKKNAPAIPTAMNAPYLRFLSIISMFTFRAWVLSKLSTILKLP